MIYVDSSFLIAVLDQNDQFNTAACRVQFEFEANRRAIFVTTRGVLNEVLAHFSRGDAVSRIRTAVYTKRLLTNPRYRVVASDFETYWAALDLYQNRPDKRYSMVDCLGMTVMRNQNITDVLTTDRDFEQEGFRNLMRTDRR